MELTELISRLLQQDRQDCMRQKVRRVVIWEALEHSQALSPLEVAHPLHPV